MYAVFIWFVSSLLFGLVWLQRFLFVFFKAPAFDFIDFSIFAIAGFLETGGSWAPHLSVPTSQVSQAQVSTPRASVCISVFVGLCASSFSFCSVFTLFFFSSLNWNSIQDISSQHYHLNAISQTVWMLGMEVWSSEGLNPRSSPQIESSSCDLRTFQSPSLSARELRVGCASSLNRREQECAASPSSAQAFPEALLLIKIVLIPHT